MSREEIARELEELAAAGFGGAELRVVTFHGWGGKPLAGMDAASLERIGHRQLSYLSDEWLDVMEFTCATAERLGLRLAINLGQGWPPGGPWITDAHRTKHLSWKSMEVTGPGTFSPEDLPKEGMVFAWKLTETEQAKTVATNSFQDLTGLIQPDGSRRALRWDVPPGRWLIGIFSVTPGGTLRQGRRSGGGPGVARGCVVPPDPHVRPVGREAAPFLRHARSWTWLPTVGNTNAIAVADATGVPPSSTLSRSKPATTCASGCTRCSATGRTPSACGTTWKPSNVGWSTKTTSTPSGDFLHARGLRHRPQIYGRGLARDLLEAYTLADTPEVEQGDYCLPEAAWAARTTGKPIISCEAFTHLHQKMGLVRRPHGEWESNPSHLRGAANVIFGEGVNRIQMHSFSYSPPGLPLPGWRMYAEIHLNRNVPWWPFIEAAQHLVGPPAVAVAGRLARRRRAGLSGEIQSRRRPVPAVG